MVEIRYGKGVSHHYVAGVQVVTDGIDGPITGAYSLREGRNLAFELARFHGGKVVRVGR